MSNRTPCPKCGSQTALGAYKCFKCSYYTRNIDRKWCIEDYELKRETIKTIEDSFTIPENVIFSPHKFHIEALKWLHKYFIYKETIIKTGIGYDPDSHRVFIPTIDQLTGDIINYKMRALSANQHLKYYFFGTRKNINLLLRKSELGTSNKVIVVEDHISGLRLQKFSDVLVLNGTSLTNEMFDYINRIYVDRILWLDPDQPGRQASRKIIKKMKAEKDEMLNRRRWLGESELVASSVAHQIYTKIEHDYRLSRVNPDNVTLDPKCYTDWDLDYILNNEVCNAYN